jgi:hypothetical protein
MKTPCLVAVLLGLALGPSMALAQDRPAPDSLQPDSLRPESLRSDLSQMLGAVTSTDQGAQVTESGNEVHIHLPLKGFLAPAGASLEAVAHPAADGLWDVTAMTVPPAGGLGTSIDQVVSYALGRQSMHGTFDPRHMTPSTFAADLGAIALQSSAGGKNTEQTIGHLTLNASMSPAADGRLDLLARTMATDRHTVTREPGHPAADTKVRRLEGTIAVDGLDSAQAIRLMAAARGSTRTGNSAGNSAGKSAGKSANPRLDPALAERLRTRAMLDATTGLLTRIQADETIHGLTFDLGGGNTGSLDRMRLQVKGRAEGPLLNAGVDVAMDELSMTSLSGDSAALVPRHLTARSVLAGVPIVKLMALLQAALMPNANMDALQTQAAALLNTQGARAEIESLDFDSGPLHVRGSARFVPRRNGQIGADIHLAATGADALMSEAMSKPGLRRILPMVFLAKGMGRVQGDSVVWDISIGGGTMTVNGTAFGQQAARTR